ncbi:hypothetical protein CIPAW_01G099200 [Carya illinoinensis]|uniref:Uncharacterized protein n=1 Tax=Carya illinoinensis TaxID=32201 RepID=A0A8T1RJW5_CARIL|nr:hypothetical protein CIPAW_01G099200 [Carya illinoinensis]
MVATKNLYVRVSRACFHTVSIVGYLHRHGSLLKHLVDAAKLRREGDCTELCLLFDVYQRQ